MADYQAVFRRAKQLGLGVTIHAGEAAATGRDQNGH